MYTKYAPVFAQNFAQQYTNSYLNENFEEDNYERRKGKILSARVISENVNNNESKFKRKHLSPGEAALRKQLSGFENTKFDIVPPERRPTVESNEKMGIGLQSAIDANSHPIEWNPNVLDY